MHFVYMIKNDFEKLYVGITDNPSSRVAYHNTNCGAQFTKGKARFRITFLESTYYINRGAAPGNSD